MTSIISVILTTIVLPFLAIFGLSFIVSTLVDDSKRVWDYVIASFLGAALGGVAAWLMLTGMMNEGKVAQEWAANILPFVPPVAIVVGIVVSIQSILANENMSLDMEAEGQ